MITLVEKKWPFDNQHWRHLYFKVGNVSCVSLTIEGRVQYNSIKRRKDQAVELSFYAPWATKSTMFGSGSYMPVDQAITHLKELGISDKDLATVEKEIKEMGWEL